MLLWEVLLLSGDRASLCRGGHDGGLGDPVAARRVAPAEAPAPLGQDVPGGQAGQVGEHGTVVLQT